MSLGKDVDLLGNIGCYIVKTVKWEREAFL